MKQPGKCGNDAKYNVENDSKPWMEFPQPLLRRHSVLSTRTDTMTQHDKAFGTVLVSLAPRDKSRVHWMWITYYKSVDECSNPVLLLGKVKL